MDESINMNNVKVKDKKNNRYGQNNNFLSEDIILMPLYKKIKVDSSLDSCDILPYNDFRLELFCPECKKRRIYNFANSSLVRVSCGPYGDQVCNSIADALRFNNYFSIKAKSDCNHNLLIVFRIISEDSLEKVGQFPSIYDLNEKINNKQFLKLFDKEYKDYYKTACSLYSFNSCIGALTYLRRIFEKLLLDTFNDNKEYLDVSLSDFNKLRMEEKITKIKPMLPQIMSEQGFSQIYSKISDGIHNLSEDECSSIFLILKAAIEEILIEKMEKNEKNKRQRKISEELSKL